jgi:acyl carrier protein
MQNAKNLQNVDNEAIQGWLIAEIEDLLSLDPQELAVDKPLVNYGLSSMTGMILSGDIEQWLGIELDPSVAWEYPTIESLAEYLAEEVKSHKLALA